MTTKQKILNHPNFKGVYKSYCLSFAKKKGDIFYTQGVLDLLEGMG